MIAVADLPEHGDDFPRMNRRQRRVRLTGEADRGKPYHPGGLWSGTEKSE